MNLPLDKGAFCISIDLELAWGNWDILTAEFMAHCLRQERDIVERALSLFERFGINATWAIVGRLLDKDERRKPDEMSAWYAPEIIERVRGAKTAQEIGSHSYAHIYYAENTAASVAADLGAVRAVHERHRLELTSFVFPRNQIGHVDLLAASGIKVFRGLDKGWHMDAAGRSRNLGRVANLVDKMIPLTPSIVHPIRHANGLVELPGSMLLLGRNGLRRLIRPGLIELKAKRGLRAAAREKGVFHLWFHPSNFYYDFERQFAILEAILAEAAAMREKGQLDIRTMGSFAGGAQS